MKGVLVLENRNNCTRLRLGKSETISQFLQNFEFFKNSPYIGSGVTVAFIGPIPLVNSESWKIRITVSDIYQENTKRIPNFYKTLTI